MTSQDREGWLPAFPPLPGQPGVIVTSRILSPTENARRGTRAGWAAFGRNFWILMASTIVGLVLLAWVFTRRSRHMDDPAEAQALFEPLAVGAAVFLVGCLLAGILKVLHDARGIARSEVGADGALTIAWSREGFTVGGGSVWRSYRYDKVLWLLPDRDGRDAVLRMDGANIRWAPAYVVIPTALIPEQAMKELGALGVVRAPGIRVPRG